MAMLIRRPHQNSMNWGYRVTRTLCSVRSGPGQSLTTVPSGRAAPLLSGLKVNVAECLHQSRRRSLHLDTARKWLSTSTVTSTEQLSTSASSSVYTNPKILAHTESGNPIVAFDTRIHPKLKPSIVRKRLARMRTYEGAEKNIRHSPWRLNLICQFVAGLPLQEALTQLQFLNKVKAPLVQKVLKRTSNLADIRDGLQPSQLEVAECFATKGTPLKRIMYHGRGRAGRMEHQHAHMRVVLREIDFKLKIYQAPTINQKKKWFMLQQQAERDGARARAEREEVERLERLEKQAAEAAAKKK